MPVKINAGRLTEVIKIKQINTNTDDYGRVLEPVELFTVRGEVIERSGEQLAQYGTAITSKIITILMYQDQRINHDHIVEFQSLDYEILHIKQIHGERSMILTCEVRTNGRHN